MKRFQVGDKVINKRREIGKVVDIDYESVTVNFPSGLQHYRKNGSVSPGWEPEIIPDVCKFEYLPEGYYIIRLINGEEHLIDECDGTQYQRIEEAYWEKLPYRLDIPQHSILYYKKNSPHRNVGRCSLE